MALKNAFSKGRLQRFPKHKISYKQKKRHNDSFRAVNNTNCIRIENGAISIPKVGKIPIILQRKLVSKIKTDYSVSSRGNLKAKAQLCAQNFTTDNQ